MKKWILFLLFLVQVNASFASGILGGEIIIRKIDTYTYQISLKCFVRPSAVGKGEGILDFGDGTSVVTPYSTSFVSEPTLYLPSTGVYSFTVNHTYSSSGFYRVTYTELNLDQGIVNMKYSVDTPFFIESEFLLDPTKVFSPIEFSTDPIFEVSIGRTFSFSSAPTDTTSFIYNYGLTVPTGIEDYVFPENLIINPQSGQLSWDAKYNGTYTQGEYLFSIKVSKYDLNGNYLGQVTRVLCVYVEDNPTIISISNSIKDPNGKVEVLANNQKTIKVILSDSINSDSLRWQAYYDSSLQNNITFSQYDSSTSSRKYSIGLLTLSSTDNIVRDIPYSIILRGVSFGNYFPQPKDVSYMFFTKDFDLPVITAIKNSADKELSVYPNPCTNQLLVSGNNDNGTVEIINNAGQKMMQTTIDNNQIDMSQLSTGIYLVIISNGNKTSKFKVVKKN